jgi:hypothetical protein
MSDEWDGPDMFGAYSPQQELGLTRAQQQQAGQSPSFNQPMQPVFTPPQSNNPHL